MVRTDRQTAFQLYIVEDREERYICISYNMGKSSLPDICYAQSMDLHNPWIVLHKDRYFAQQSMDFLRIP